MERKMSKESSKSTLNADSLRRALRLIHCLQRERGPSCAPTENEDFLSKSRADTDHAMADCQNIRLSGGTNFQLVVERIRGMIDEQSISSHRTLVCFTTLISAVLHDHVLSFTSRTSSVGISSHDAKGQAEKPANNGFHRIHSHQNFRSMGSDNDNMKRSQGAAPQRQRSQSSGLFSDMFSSDAPSTNGMAVGREASEPTVRFNASGPVDAPSGGVLIDQVTSNGATSSRLASLSQLLSIFVCIKESTGKERASLYSMLASKQAPAEKDCLLSDVVMEVENQRRQLEQLQHIRNHPLQSLVQELVIMSEDMQQVQSLLSSGCMLDSIKEYYSASQLWDVLTVYMDKLHSLELLIVEEMELALPTVIHEEIGPSEPGVGADLAILMDAFGATSSSQLLETVQAMSSDEVKRRLLRALQTQSSQPSATIFEEKQDEDVANKGVVDELMDDLYGKVPAMKEWEIDVYELKFQKRIGQGAAGTTYLADWSGETVAVKVASITEFGLDGWRTEVQALQKLHHPNIIRLLGSVYHRNPLTFCLVLEYCDAGDLASALTRTVPPDFFFRVATSIAKGLVYLHHRGFIHRDLKPQNVLLQGDLASGQYQVKVTDFGVAADLNDLEDRAPETGSYRYMSCEMIRHEIYTETADVYSFGVIMWQLLTHEDPFANMGPIEAAAVVAMEKARPPFPPDTPPPIKDLITRCWTEDPASRPSFSEILLELNALKFDLAEDARNWLDAPLGHTVYRKTQSAPTSPAAPPTASPVVVDANNQDLKKKKKFGLFARKSSYF